jgi:uncharacterized protein (DUF433 family)
MIATQDHLGIGIYTPSEAAFYARVSPKMMTRWVFGSSRGRPVIERQLRDSDEKIVTFLDFVQTLAIREVRQRYGLPLQRIRDGVEGARRRYGLDYPLACKHRIFLFSDQRKAGHGQIVIRLRGEQPGDGDEYVQLTGRDEGARLIRPVVEMFLDDLCFDASTGYATMYRPMTEGEASVVLDPHRRFGEPLVDPGGYTVESLWRATNAEGGIEEAASAFGVTPSEVRLANKYFDGLMKPDAA